jgi:hypothetical protein
MWQRIGIAFNLTENGTPFSIITRQPIRSKSKHISRRHQILMIHAFALGGGGGVEQTLSIFFSRNPI